MCCTDGRISKRTKFDDFIRYFIDILFACVHFVDWEMTEASGLNEVSSWFFFSHCFLRRWTYRAALIRRRGTHIHARMKQYPKCPFLRSLESFRMSFLWKVKMRQAAKAVKPARTTQLNILFEILPRLYKTAALII